MSIFDDDQTDPVAATRTTKKAHKNPFADPDERLEPMIEKSSELDDLELAEESTEFTPLDRKRNRHLSSSLDNIRDNGPAHIPSPQIPTPEQEPSQKKEATSQAVRNPFAGNDNSETRKAPPQDNPFLSPAQRPQTESKATSGDDEQAQQDRVLAGERLAINKEPNSKVTPPTLNTPPPAKPARQQTQPRPKAQLQETHDQEAHHQKAHHKETRQQTTPEKSPQPRYQPQPQPTPAPPEFARRQQPPIGVTSLTLWTLLAMAILLAAWSMVQLSSVKEQLVVLSNEVKQIEQPAVNTADINSESRLARLENNYQAMETHWQSLESRWQELPKSAPNTQPTELAPLQKQLTELQKQQQQLQSAIESLKQQAKASAASKPAAEAAVPVKPSGWVINIASLSNRDNAIRLANKGKALGADTRVESYPSQGRTLYRVRAFGYNSQSAAEKAALRLQTGLKVSGLIVRKAD